MDGNTQDTAADLLTRACAGSGRKAASASPRSRANADKAVTPHHGEGVDIDALADAWMARERLALEGRP